MKLLGLIAVLLCINSVVCEDDYDFGTMAEIIKDFTARVAYLMLYSDPVYNYAFSGLRIVHDLMTMYSVGSEKTKSDIELWLGLTESMKVNGCQIIDHFTNYDSMDKSKFNLFFNKTLFYSDKLTLKDGVLNNGCFGNNAVKLDFTKNSTAMDEINTWYDVSHELFYQHYLQTPLGVNTHFVFMSVLHLTVPESGSGYHYVEDIKFENINGESTNVSGMQRTGEFFHVDKPDMNLTLIRHDLPRTNYSLVYMIPQYKTEDFHTELFNYFEIEYFMKAIESAMSMTDKKQRTVILPDLEIATRIDLRDSLSFLDMSFFNESKPLENLTDSESTLFQIPYSEFVKIVGDEDGKDENMDTIEIKKPFIYCFIDKQHNVPVFTAVYTGIVPESM